MRRYTDGYELDAGEGLEWRVPLEIILREAVNLVPRLLWTTCPECGAESPLMFGDPARSYWCPACQIGREYPGLIEDAPERC